MTQLSRMRPALLRTWLVGGLGALALAGAVVALATPAPSAMAAENNPPIPAAAELSSWRENGTDGRYVLQMLDGEAPQAAVTGEILSDTQCAPDDQGINHCHNEIRLPDGTTITVIDNHSMMENPCLTPGEKITLKPLDTGWIVGTLAD